VKENKNINQNCLSISNQCLGVRTRRLSRITAKIFDDALRPYGIKSTQYTILVFIGRMGKSNPKMLGEKLALEKSSLSRALKNLQKDALINIEMISGLQTQLSLTKKGNQLIDTTYPVWQSAQAQVKNEVENLVNDIKVVLDK